MRLLLPPIFCAVLAFFVTAAYGHGVIVAGENRSYSSYNFFTSYNKANPNDAAADALAQCRTFAYLKDCRVLTSIVNGCAAVMWYLRPAVGLGSSPSEAQANASQECKKQGGGYCNSGATVCDRTDIASTATSRLPGSATSNTTEPSFVQSPVFGFVVTLIFFGLCAAGYFWMKNVISEADQPKLPSQTVVEATKSEPVADDLPPPVFPKPPSEPLKGIMRVDVTQTDKTVDVFIKLSPDAVTQLAAMPEMLDWTVEEHFDGLKEHMDEFSHQYDMDTKYDTIKDEWAGYAPFTKDGFARRAISKEITESANEARLISRKENKRYALKAEEQRYKEAHSVRLVEYLKNPFRKVVRHRVEATAYIQRLEGEYLPRIRNYFVAVTHEEKVPRSYDL